MKKLRTATIFLLCSVLLCGTLSAHHQAGGQHHAGVSSNVPSTGGSHHAGHHEGLFSDIPAGASYCAAVDALYDAGVVTGDSNGRFDPQNQVSRAEAAAIICRMCGLDSTAKTRCETSFSDVPSTHWASGYIAAACKLGVVNGYGGGKFGPDDPVSYPQMVKMLLCAAGHADDAEQAGGFPQGYISTASRLGICAADLSCTQDCPRSDMAQMCYHTALAANSCHCTGCQRICEGCPLN